MRQNTAYTHCDSLLHNLRSVCCNSIGFMGAVPCLHAQSIQANAAPHHQASNNEPPQPKVLDQLPKFAAGTSGFFRFPSYTPLEDFIVRLIRQSECIFESRFVRSRDVAITPRNSLHSRSVRYTIFVFALVLPVTFYAECAPCELS